MRNQYRSILKKFFHQEVSQTRYDLGISQEKMAEKLALAVRTYVDLDHGKTCCSEVTLALYLIYVCPNPNKFLEELRYVFETEIGKAA